MDSFQRHIRLRADLILLLVSIIWGSAFVVQRIAAPDASPFIFNGLRFLLGALVLAPIAWYKAGYRPVKSSIEPKNLTGIAVAGLFLTAGAALQQAGLRYTTAGNAGFITGLYVVLIPLIQAVFLKSVAKSTIWIAALLAAIGLFLLSTGGSLFVKLGDALELAGSVFWALHVIWIGNIVRRTNVLHLAIGQYLVCGTVSLIIGFILEPSQINQISTLSWAVLYTGIFSVGVGYTLQASSQKVAPAADAAIILSMEAVFAAWFGWLFLNETLTTLQLFGCLIMFSGMLLAQADSFHRRLRNSDA